MKKFLGASLPALYLCALFATAGARSCSLDGAWQFAVDREGKLEINDLSSVKDWREVRAPAAPAQRDDQACGRRQVRAETDD